MATTAGALTQDSVTSTTATLTSAAASGGAAPYTYQWYRDTASGFTPGVGNLVSGATDLELEDTGLVPNTQYYYKVVATDSGSVTGESAQLAVATSVPTLSQNQFAQSPFLGMIDMRFPYNTVSVQIDSSQDDDLYAGAAVKIVDSAGGVPKVVACSAESDECFGFINFDIKTVTFEAGDMAEISQKGNYMFLYATEAIARGVQVVLDLATNGGIQAAAGETGSTIVGYAYDKASAAGDLIRVVLAVPSFEVV